MSPHGRFGRRRLLAGAVGVGTTAAVGGCAGMSSGGKAGDGALQGGVDIDVYFTYTAQALALRGASGLAADLTHRVQGDPQLSSYLDAAEPKTYVSDGRIKALATAREPNFVLINEKLRQASGVELPESWTIEEYRRAAQRLRAPGRAGAYSIPDLARIILGPNYWYTSSGGSNFSDPAFLTGLQIGQQMIEEQSTYPWTEVLARQLKAYQQNAFLTEDFALWPTAPFNLRYLQDSANYPHDFLVSAAPTPTVPGGGNWNCGQFNNFIMINPKSRRQDLAWEFVRFWVGEGAGLMLKAGKVPAIAPVGDDALITALLGANAEKYFDVDSFRRVLLADDIKLCTDTNLTAYPEIALANQQHTDLCWINEQTPSAAVRDVDRIADAAIRRNRKSDQ